MSIKMTFTLPGDNVMVNMSKQEQRGEKTSKQEQRDEKTSKQEQRDEKT
jgi:hypothetical protein